VAKEQKLESANLETLNGFIILGKKHLALFTTSSIFSIATSIFIIFASLMPIAIFKGYPLSGYISLVYSDLYTFEKPIVFRALESVSTITLSLFIGSSMPITLSLFVLAKLILGEKRHEVRNGYRAINSIYIELIPASSIVAMLTLTLFTAILRVVVVDIVPALPLGGCIDTSAGRLCVERSTALFTWIYSLAISYRPMLFATMLLLLALGALTMYIALELRRARAVY